MRINRTRSAQLAVVCLLTAASWVCVAPAAQAADPTYTCDFVDVGESDVEGTGHCKATGGATTSKKESKEQVRIRGTRKGYNYTQTLTCNRSTADLPKSVKGSSCR
ncbi:hypothetical protein [Nocardia colli]|uniref:hypothetical protein n=1 Tax=Nocardia colli TaxID=2545717 RepID=UPI0035DB368A